MSIKNPHIIHFVIEDDDRFYYLCNRACSMTVSKSTFEKKFVTCKNCLRALEK